jgi:hypothetical protein
VTLRFTPTLNCNISTKVEKGNQQVNSKLHRATAKAKGLWAKPKTRLIIKLAAGAVALGVAYGAGVESGQEGRAPEWVGVTVYEDGGVRVEESEWAQRERSDQWFCEQPENEYHNDC